MLTCPEPSCKLEVGQGVNSGVLIPWARLFGLQQSTATAETAVRKKRRSKRERKREAQRNRGKGKARWGSWKVEERDLLLMKTLT